MIPSTIIFLGLAAVANAVPFMTERDLNSTIWTPEHVLQQDEVILYGEGRMEVVHVSVYEKLLESEGVNPITPEIDHDWIKAGAKAKGKAKAPRDLEERQSCGSTTSYVTDRTQRFVDWDVQMSPVVIGQGRNGIDVTVASSYSVSNGVTVSGGLDITAIKNRLGASFGLGETGVVITRPWTNRRYGRAFRGCVGSMQQTGTWMADSHEEGSYEGVRWVAGAITMCIKRQSGIPLSRCNGGGNFR
ncbi:hypothetical protein NXS19_014237 [Fusarium pseudograminearum]|nr:hypothetical protein NXS19_014237 [Fusarium pseudograminearum]